ncbi:MAG: Uma2 family endonuclease, partial [Gemmataceae bacterium]|nr:Uma2 family endonuclease [Gemmataceae bacterium]
RLPRGLVPGGDLGLVPDLVGEVKSPSDRWGEVFAKIGEYLEAGVRVVVVADAESMTVSLYRQWAVQEILREGDTLTIPDVLPGFSVPVARLFA